MAAWVPTAPAIIAVFICEAVRWNRLMPWTSSSIHTATVRPNRDGHGMLPMSPPGHHRVGLAFREIPCSVAALRQECGEPPVAVHRLQALRQPALKPNARQKVCFGLPS
jgi:hypothetical protein